MGWPLTVTTYRLRSAPMSRTCSRSTEESTYRAVPVPVDSSPRVFHGSMAPRSSNSAPSRMTLPMRGKRNSVNGSSQLVSNAMPCARKSAATSAMS
ncbi:Uncharacterised protein [Mycobacteroides abscessus subsp. abscessus]|nr:Uncharacterised protein [Mycobacteroides abscessus subsp. abscessus]